MKKSLGIVLAVLLVAVLSAPAMGATLSLSGKYVGQIKYDGGVIQSVNPDGSFTGIDLLYLSTLYLNLDFAEGELMSAHIPLRLWVGGCITGMGGSPDRAVVMSQNPSDNYLFVFKGAPLALSLTDKTSGEYSFASFGDPLGLVKYINPDASGGYATFKAAGKPFGLGFTSYFIAADPKGTTYPRFTLGRVTYGLTSGHTIGAIYAAKETSSVSSTLVNVEGDITGPLYINEGATFTAALALSKTESAGVWSSPVNAFELNLAGIKASNFTLSGNVRAVDPTFAAVAPGDPDISASDIGTYQGWRQVQGEAVTNVNIAGQAVKLTLGDDYRVRYDGNINATDKKANNKIYGSGEFKPSEPVTVTVGGYYQDWLITSGSFSDDYKKNVYGKVKYAPADNLEVNAGAQWMGANTDALTGSGFKLDGSATVKPAAGVLVKGNAAYQAGTYDFIGGAGAVSASQTRLDAEGYAEAKQTFVAAGVKQVDTVLAGLARGIKLSSTSAATTYVGYAEANFIISDLLSDKIAVMTGKSTESGYISPDHYKTTLYNKFTYQLSSNSTFALGYTWKDNAGTVDAAYTVKLGTSTMVLSYGKTGLSSTACAKGFDDGRPWAWLCNASNASDPDLYKLTVTVPF